VGRLSARLAPADLEGPFAAWRRLAEQRLERGALIATDQGAARAEAELRQAIKGAGLGNLGQALKATSDLKRGARVHRYSNGGFSASGLVYVRSGSERTRGALTAYTAGAQIGPVRGRWLWIPTDDIPRRGAGRQRLTPGNWVSSGMDRRIGPLVRINSVNGNPLLVVKSASVSLAGRSRSARALTKRGAARSGQRAKELIVAFVGIPRTARAARIDVRAIHAGIMTKLPDLFAQALGRI